MNHNKLKYIPVATDAARHTLRVEITVGTDGHYVVEAVENIDLPVVKMDA